MPHSTEDTEDLQALKKRRIDARFSSTEDISIKGTIEEDEAHLPKKQYATSFRPKSVKCPWFTHDIQIPSNNWLCPHNLNIPGQKKIPPHANLSQIYELTTMIELNKETNRWTIPEEKKLSKPQQEIAFGFLNGFSNAVGRSATWHLLDLLFQSEEVIVRNVGGSSPSPHSRDIKFIFDNEASPSIQTTSKRHYYHPDVVVVAMEELVSLSELLVVKVKSSDLSYRDKVQLRYHLIPLLVRNDCSALGLLISSSMAILMKAVVVKGQHGRSLSFSEKSYNFCDDLSQNFLEMCSDVYHHVCDI